MDKQPADTRDKLLLVNFIGGGGIKQFTTFMTKELAAAGIDFDYVETRAIGTLLHLCRNRRDVVFCINNIRIYVLLVLLKDFSPVLILHDHKVRAGASRVERLLVACVHRFAHRFRRIVVHSDAPDLAARNNVVVTKMPFHAPDFASDVKTRVLFFGRIEPYKNLPFLIELAARTQQTTEYFVAGSGEIEPELRSQIGRTPNVSLINAYIDERTIRLLFEWCDYLVLPYSDITQTGLVDQAGYFSKPVILSDIEGFRDYRQQAFCVGLRLGDMAASAGTIMGLPVKGSAEYARMCEQSKQNYLRSSDAWPTYIDVMLRPWM